jgi:hypothetical protein
MLFSAKVMEDRAAGKIMIAASFVGVVFILLGMLLPSLNDTVPFFIVGMVVFVVVMSILFKGDLSSYRLANDLYIYVDGMQISKLIFPFAELSELKFEFQSYQENDNYRTQPKRTRQSYGLGNNLSFTYKNQHFHYQFFLQSRQHYVSFVQMLEQLYEHGIGFSETNLKGKTFLMQNVNEEQLVLLKRRYHYH